MNKRSFLPVIIITGLLAVIAGLIFLLKPKASGEPLKGIPVDASVVVKVNDFQKLTQKSLPASSLWNEVKAVPLFGKIDRQIQFLDSLARHIPDAKYLLQTQPFYISAHFTGKDNISLLYVIKMPSRLNERKINDLIYDLVVRDGTISERKYEGASIREVSLLNQQWVDNFSFTVVNDIFLLSFSTVVLEDAIRQVISGESVADQEGFQEMYNAALKNTNVETNIFINFKEFPRCFSSLVKTDYKSEVRAFDNFSNWGEMDVNMLSDALLLNGFVYTADSLISTASLFINQDPQRITVDEILPATVSAFLTLSLSDIGKYFSDYKEYLGEIGRLTSYNNTIQSLNNTYDTNLLEVFSALLDNEITLAFDAGNAENDPIGELVLMRVKSQSYAEEQISAILKNIAMTESRSLESYTYTYRFDNELSYQIRNLPVKNFCGKLFGGLFTVLEDHYYIFLDNYLIFASSRELLQELIASHLLNRNLIADPSYRDYKTNISSRSNVFFFCKLAKVNRTFSKYLTTELVRNWEDHKQVFEDMQTFGFQLYSNDNMLYNNMLVRSFSSAEAESATVWESRLDTITDFKPIFVLNHNTNQKEVFVQDLNNNIYLINQVGRVLWKVHIDEKINSEVYQIDFYNNGRLQLLFGTRNQLHLLDRNGNYVEKYPIRLRSPSTSGISLFDYDNNKDYRIFLAGEDRRVYAYDKAGNLVSGWTFNGTESEVIRPLQHFRVRDRDYIVFGDKFKTYILDRRGNTRTSVQTFFQKSSGNSYFLDVPGQSANARLVTTDTAGKVYFLYLDGRVNSLDLQTCSDDHYFDYHDLDGDGNNEYIFLEDNILTAYRSDKSRLFEVSFKEDIGDRPVYYEFSATDRKIGIVAHDENLIYLINNDGSIYRNFPMQGNTLFSIGILDNNRTSFNLLVGSRDNFLYNYQLK